MKASKVLIFLLLFSGFSLQTLAQSKVRLGLKFNPIISWARATDEDKNTVDGLESSAKLGFSGGLLFDLSLSERLGVHSGLHIVRRGYETRFGEVETEAGLTTIEVPLALKMRSGDLAEGLRLRGLFGGSLGLNAGSKTTVRTQGIEAESRKTSDFYQPVSINFLVGAGIEYDLDNVGMIDLGISYQHGLTRTNKKATSNDIRALLHYLSLDIGFFF